MHFLLLFKTFNNLLLTGPAPSMQVINDHLNRDLFVDVFLLPVEYSQSVLSNTVSTCINIDIAVVNYIPFPLALLT